VIGDVIDPVLSRAEPMGAESTVPGKVSVGILYGRLIVLRDVKAGVDIAEVLGEVIFPVARPHLLDAVANAQDANPRLARVTLLLVPPPVAFSNIPFPAFPRALVNPVLVSAEQLRVVSRLAPSPATALSRCLVSLVVGRRPRSLVLACCVVGLVGVTEGQIR